MGRKPDDKYVVPLAPILHRLATESQHSGNEREWWSQFKIDPIAVAKELWGKNRIQMENVITMRSPWEPKVKDRIREIMREK